jgi:hypothetical protein
MKLPIRRMSRCMKIIFQDMDLIKKEMFLGSSPDHKNRNFCLFVDRAVGNAAKERGS